MSPKLGRRFYLHSCALLLAAFIAVADAALVDHAPARAVRRARGRRERLRRRADDPALSALHEAQRRPPRRARGHAAAAPCSPPTSFDQVERLVVVPRRRLPRPEEARAGRATTSRSRGVIVPRRRHRRAARRLRRAVHAALPGDAGRAASTSTAASSSARSAASMSARSQKALSARRSRRCASGSRRATAARAARGRGRLPRRRRRRPAAAPCSSLGRWRPDRLRRLVRRDRAQGTRKTRTVRLPKDLAGTDARGAHLPGRRRDPPARHRARAARLRAVEAPGAYWVLACRPRGEVLRDRGHPPAVSRRAKTRLSMVEAPVISIVAPAYNEAKQPAGVPRGDRAGARVRSASRGRSSSSTTAAATTRSACLLAARVAGAADQGRRASRATSARTSRSPPASATRAAAPSSRSTATGSTRPS